MKINLFLLVVLSVTISLSSCKKDDESTTFYWDETSCADPWDQYGGDTAEERMAYLEDFLDDEKIKVQDISFKIDPNKVQTCEACHCTTGKVFKVNVPWADKRRMKKLNFYQ
ncbi:MAG: hypothetical protein ACJASF_002436 [Vicingaceae bacterium]|jgi:hypothetical protein